jgi:hypothetical protein
MTPEEELLDESAQRILSSLHEEDAASTNNNNNGGGHPLQRTLQGNVHDNTAQEQDGNDSDGQQGGQNWTAYPTHSPTLQPTLNPTVSPTYQPTMKSVAFTVRGQMWYDANGNGVRDSNVYKMGYDDVEYKFGVGGVNLMLRECDWATKQPLADSTIGAYTRSAGVGPQGEPMIVNFDLGGGVYEFVNVNLERAYYVEASTPAEFRLTSGVCNDELVATGELDPSWSCDNAVASTTGSSGSGSTMTGRSRECIYVDRFGNVTGTLSMGVMQVGDSTPLTTNVALVLAFNQPSDQSGGRRHLEEMISRATKVSTPEEESASGYRRYLLSSQDKETIGEVTSEVIASNLDKRLEANGIELDSVLADDVMLGVNEDGTENELAVAMAIHGHYSPPPHYDFDYMVQDSIDRDSDEIRRSLRDYNEDCRDQTNMVLNQGFTVEDFAEIHSMNGALQNRVKGKNSPKPTGGVYRQSCAEARMLPSYFETSLKELKARKVSEVKAELYGVEYVANENRGGLAPWAIGPVAGFTGLIALLMGVFVFRRALGPRYADKYQESNKTAAVDKDDKANSMLNLMAKDKEAKRKARRGGGGDDDSVDSAFYSDADEDEYDENDKERRRKRKEKEQRDGGSGRRKSSRKSTKLTASMKQLNQSLTKKTKTAENLSASQGSDDTDERTSSEEGGSRSPQRRSSSSANKKRSSKSGKSRSEEGGSSEMRKSRKSESGSGERSKKKESPRRGRSTRSGGDNANAIV